MSKEPVNPLPGLVIFDCDGVLVDSEPLSIAVDQQVLADLGWSISRQEIIERFVGRSHDHFLATVEEHLGHPLPADWEDRYQGRYREAYQQDLRPVDGIVQALDVIDSRTCIASSGSHDKMRFTLGITGLWQRFEGRIFSASDVLRGKPAPDLFLYAAAAMAVEPADCVVVEDSRAGVQAALAAKMKVIGYAGGVTPRPQLTLPGVMVIDHMRSLPAAIAAAF